MTKYLFFLYINNQTQREMLTKTNGTTQKTKVYVFLHSIIKSNVYITCFFVTTNLFNKL